MSFKVNLDTKIWANKLEEAMLFQLQDESTSKLELELQTVKQEIKQLKGDMKQSQLRF